MTGGRWRRSHTLGWLAAALALAARSSTGQDAPISEYHIGMLAPRGGETAVARWAPTAEYLSSQVKDARFSLHPVTYRDLGRAITGSHLDFLIVNAAVYVDAEVRFGARRIATLRSRYLAGRATAMMAGAVVRRADRSELGELRRILDLKLAAIDPVAMSWIAARREMTAVGIDPQRDLLRVEFLQTSDAVLEAVRSGRSDVGVVAAGVVERAVATGQIPAGTLAVIPQPDADSEVFPFVRTTRAYPELAFARLPRAPDEVVQQVAVALLSLHEDDPSCRAADNAGWTIPLDYQRVRDCLREQRLSPYNTVEQVSLGEAIRQHSGVFALLASFVVVLGLGLARLTRLNRRVDEARARVEAELVEHGRTEVALRASEAQYRALFESANDPILIFDSESEEIFEANVRACETYGFTREELIGRSLKTLTVDVVRGERQLSRLRQEGSCRFYETAHLRRDGSQIQMVVSSSMIDFRGRPAVLSINRDVTEQRLLERQLLHAQKMEAIGRLAGGVAHDLNNILQALLSTLAAVRVTADDASRVARAFDEIEANVKRAAAVVRQLLLFARREVSRRERLELALVVRAAGALVRRLIPANIAFRMDLESPGPVVEVDRGQIEQVLMNLVVNAVDAMPAGGELVTKVETTADGMACLAVRDTGPGMSAELVARVFEPFFTTKSPEKGTGLGLAVAHGILQAHGGRIDVDSRPGEGTTMRVVLPLVTEQLAGVTATPEDKLPHGSGERVLLVEDQDEARRGLKELVLMLGYACEAAADAEAAEAFAGTSRFDLLLTDLMLPGRPGHELAERLQERWPELRVILMSGYAQDDAVRHGLSHRSVRFLQKPFDMATLAVALHAALTAPVRPGAPAATPLP